MSDLSHFIAWSLGLARPETQTTQAERECLASLVRDRSVVVEVGVWHGVTTSLLRSAMAANGVLYAVDPFPVGRLGVSLQRRIARRTVGRAGAGRVEWMRMSGEAAAAEFRRSKRPAPDVVFLDGDHSFAAVSAEWAGWSSLLLPGGVVALHDSRSTPDRSASGNGPEQLLRECVAGDDRFEIAAEVDSLTVVRRLPDVR